ncbi:MAG TPA: glycoside hydrolase family 31 protein [Myxococcota bacterium]|nr:glycoside hydrolase family 31 protein [Myxococcota bacterium]HOH77800.1 glycoside hydrolase family 31 protein [Myxococcota bacterium]
MKVKTILLVTSVAFVVGHLVACGDQVGPGDDLGDMDSVGFDVTPEDSGEVDVTPDDRDILAGPLSNGVLLYRNDAGDLVLAHKKRDLLVLPGDVGPVTRKFGQTYESLFGQWRFVRTDVVELPMAPGSVEQGEGLYGHIGDVIVLNFADEAGSVSATLIVESLEDESTRLYLGSGGLAGDSIAFPIRCGADDTFHGFGEQYNAIDQRGQAFDLFVSEQGIGRESQGEDDPMWWLTGNPHTTYFPMPYFINMATGSGLLLETEWRTSVDLCATDPAVAWFEVDAWRTVRMRLFHGPGPMEVIRQLGDVVGRPVPVPEWAFKTWLCTQGGPEAVAERIQKAKTIQIPFGAVWIQDWTGRRTNIGGGSGVQYRWQADPEHYPDLAGLIDGLHADGIRAFAYVNPFVMKNLPNHFDTMEGDGMLVSEPSSGNTYEIDSPAGVAGVPDLTWPATAEYVQDQLGRIVSDLGFDGWMADFGEYFPMDARVWTESNPGAYHNLFPVDWVRQSRDVMKKLRPEGDFVYFARSGWTGVQGVAQIHWVGDQEATWSQFDGLPTVVPAMLNLGLSGQPYVTHDIAGFSGGPSTKELYLRWTELGAFTPFMRTHDGNNRDDNWCWDRDYYTGEHFRRMAVIHDQIAADFFIPLAAASRQTGAPILRAMMLVFPEDRATWSISDQYMIGDKLLVAPILSPSNPDSVEEPDFDTATTARQVYLPAGDWYDVWNQDAAPIKGPQTITVNAPFGRPPVFSFGEPYAVLVGDEAVR